MKINKRSYNRGASCPCQEEIAWQRKYLKSFKSCFVYQFQSDAGLTSSWLMAAPWRVTSVPIPQLLPIIYHLENKQKDKWQDRCLMRQRLRSVKLCWTPSDMPVLNYAECPQLPPHKRSMLWVCSWMIYEIKEWPTCLSLWEVSSLQHCQPQPHNKPNLNITQINPSSSLAPLQALLCLVLTSQPWHGVLFFTYIRPCSYFRSLRCSPLKTTSPPPQMAVYFGPGQTCSVSLLFPCCG